MEMMKMNCWTLCQSTKNIKQGKKLSYLSLLWHVQNNTYTCQENHGGIVVKKQSDRQIRSGSPWLKIIRQRSFGIGSFEQLQESKMLAESFKLMQEKTYMSYLLS
jgi:hypothetical protein